MCIDIDIDAAYFIIDYCIFDNARQVPSPAATWENANNNNNLSIGHSRIRKHSD